MLNQKDILSTIHMIDQQHKMPPRRDGRYLIV